LTPAGDRGRPVVGDIEYPEWVPASVIAAAKQLLSSNLSAEAKAPIHRLIEDERMKRVWGELLKKRRDDPRKYKYYRGPNFPDFPEVWERAQQRNIRNLFFDVAAGLYHGQRPVIARHELVESRKPYVDQARKLEQTKINLRRLGIGRPDEIAVIDGLITECMLNAENIGRSWIIVGRGRDDTDPHLREFLYNLVQLNEKLFGAKLLGTTATISSVRFDIKVTVQMVREADGA
jgi:hypothetical protein